MTDFIEYAPGNYLPNFAKADKFNLLLRKGIQQAFKDVPRLDNISLLDGVFANIEVSVASDQWKKWLSPAQKYDMICKKSIIRGSNTFERENL